MLNRNVVHKEETAMSRKKTQKFIVYLMLLSMLITTILTGVSMWF
ncbi:stressosome-associated protein Prli42 [Parageobacillus thermoglucosidasius]|nr:stressosome-associated protein Prli42 [Parageobacillus thermoglucosidasius]